MPRQVEVEVAGIGKLVVSVIETPRHIQAETGDITCDGNLNLDELEAAIQKELKTDLPVHLKMGNVTCTGNINF